MCKASITAKSTRDAEQGDVTFLDYSGHGLPQFVRDGDGVGVEACVTCPKIGRKMRFYGIPKQAQHDLNIGESIEGIFIEEEDDHCDLLFHDNRLLDIGTILHSRDNDDVVTVEMLDMTDNAELRNVIQRIGGFTEDSEPTAEMATLDATPAAARHDLEPA